MLNNNKVKIQDSPSHTNNGTCRLWLNVPFTFHGTLDKIKLFYRIHGEDRGGSEGEGVGAGAGIGMTLETSGLSGPHGDDAVVRALVFNQCGHP